MFAVPGWAVSASSLVQEKANSKAGKSVKSQSAGDAERRSKKRKRSEEAGDNGAVSRSSEHEPVHKGSQTALGRTRDSSNTSLRKSKKAEIQGGHDDQSLSQEQDQSGQKHSERNTNRSSIQSKKKKAIVQANSREEKSGSENRRELQDVDAVKAVAAIPPVATAGLTPLQAKMRNKLTSARFRHLNETLYTTTSSEALKLFTSSPELYSDYHAGFAQQVKDSWPQNPVEVYVKSIKTRGSISESTKGVLPLPRRKTGSCTIADLGCGDAPLARGSQSVTGKLKLKFHNYDLHAANSFVTKADISDLPLRDGEADIVVFCLSLMGTNWISFVEEAWRVLRGDGKGEVWVAEVKSRFGRVTKGRVVENSVGKRRKNQKPKRDDGDDEYDGPEHFAEDERTADEPHDETDISAFVKVFARRGFQIREGSVNKGNKMFVSMIFTKTGIPTAGKHNGLKWTGKEYQKQQEVKSRFAGGQKDGEEMTVEEEAKALKPCVYKIR